MWNLIRDLGNGEKLVSCSECGYQTVVDELPNECPNCGEVMEGMATKSINLKQSSLDVKELEPEVYEYDRGTPVYKLWYFWVGIVIALMVALVGSRYIAQRLNSEPIAKGDETAEEISFDVPTGWSKVDDNTYAGPGEGSNITVITSNVSRLDDVDALSKLVADLSEIEEIQTREINGIDGRYISWTTRKIVEGEEFYTDYARYMFIHKNIFYILTFKTTDGNPEAFDSFLMSIQL